MAAQLALLNAGVTEFTHQYHINRKVIPGHKQSIGDVL